MMPRPGSLSNVLLTSQIGEFLFLGPSFWLIRMKLFGWLLVILPDHVAGTNWS